MNTFTAPDGAAEFAAEVFADVVKAEPIAPVDPAAVARADHSRKFDRCLKYFTKMPDAISGSGGHTAFFLASRACVKFDLSEDEHRRALEWFSANKSDPAWTPREIEHKVKQGREKFAAERGKLLLNDARESSKRRTERIDTTTGEVVTVEDASSQCSTAETIEGRRKLLMRPGNTVNDPKSQYLWKRRLVRGALNVVFSRPGRGKSTVGADLTSRVTNGKSWPDGAPCEQGYVIYMKGEGTDASIRDRMALAGADDSRYGIVSLATGAGEAMIDLALDTAELAELVTEHPDTKLIIIDTLDSLFPSMRMIDNANIRRCLWPLQELAEKHGVCVVLFAHTNKGGYADPIDRLSGGRAIGGAARSVWYLGKTQHDAPECYLAPVKCNDFLSAPALTYRITGLGPDQPGVIAWGDEAEHVSAWDLDTPPKAGEGSKGERCKAWLADLLADGPLETGLIAEKAKAEGFGEFVMKKAKRELGIELDAAKGVQPTRWYQCLPGQSAPDLTPGNAAMAGGF